MRLALYNAGHAIIHVGSFVAYITSSHCMWAVTRPYPMNCLLGGLSEDLRTRITTQASLVDLPAKALLEDVGVRPGYVYFLNQGIASAVVPAGPGSLEVSLIGSEGISAVFSLLGSAPPISRCVMQMQGSGYKLHFELLRSLFLSYDELRDAILNFAQQQSFLANQLAVCSALHNVDQRLARWLLMAQDRVGSDHIRMTHDSLARLLGVHRPSITLSIAESSQSGFIKAGSNLITILMREGLEATACDCYPVTRLLLESITNR